MADDNGQPTEGSGGGEQSGGGTPPSASASWRDGLAEDLKSNEVLSKFTDINALAKGYINAEQLIGRDKIPMPKTDEEYAMLYQRLGAPKSPDGYKIAEFTGYEFPAPIKEAIGRDTEWFKNVAHSIGLSDKQANSLFTEFMTKQAKDHASVESEKTMALNMADTNLRNKYGQAYDVKMAIANRTIAHFGDDDLVEAIAASGLGRNAQFVDMMITVGEAMGEEIGIDKKGNAVKSQKDLLDEISGLQNSPAYFTADHPDHKRIVERVQQLMKQAYPG